MVFDIDQPSHGKPTGTFYKVDVTNTEQIKSAIADVVKRNGSITGLATCAGIMQTKPFVELEEREVRKVMDVNFLGTFLSVQLCAKAMLESGTKGAIVTVSSTAGRSYRPLAAHYAASKAAVISLTRSAALALAPHGIRVNCVAPGMIETPMMHGIFDERSKLFGKSVQEARRAFEQAVPLGSRLGKPEEVASAIVHLLGEDSSYITGEVLGVTGGAEYA